MCGLCGVFGTSSFNSFQYDSFKWLLNFSATRGEDSTGVAIRKTDVKTKETVIGLYKSEGPPANLYFRFPEIFDPLKGDLARPPVGENISMLMGHNRATTIGATNADNAHPFAHGHIVGTHNGTLSWRTSLPAVPDKPGCTDSEQIYYAMSQGWTLQDIVGKTNGAIALAWYDMKEKSFNIFRNKERTLFYVPQYTSTIYYASEEWILSQALIKGRNPELVKSITPVSVMNHYKWDLSKSSLSLSITPVQEASYKTGAAVVSANKPVASTLTYREVDRKGAGKTDEPFRKETGWLTVDFENKEDFDSCVRHGCAYCSTALTWDEQQRGEISWLERDTPLCETCAKEWSDNAFYIAAGM